MLKLLLTLNKVLNEKEFFYLYDGPDYQSMQYNITTTTPFTSKSFQVSILYHGSYSNIEINFKG